MKLEKEVEILNIIPYLNKTEFYCQINEDILEELIKYKGQKVKLTLEIEEPILDEEERKYLSDVIRPFRDKVIGIYKYNSVLSDYEEIAIDTREDYNSNHMTHLPPFEKGTMYQGMVPNKEYTLNDLNL